MSSSWAMDALSVCPSSTQTKPHTHPHMSDCLPLFHCYLFHQINPSWFWTMHGLCTPNGSMAGCVWALGGAVSWAPFFGFAVSLGGPRGRASLLAARRPPPRKLASPSHIVPCPGDGHPPPGGPLRRPPGQPHPAWGGGCISAGPSGYCQWGPCMDAGAAAATGAVTVGATALKTSRVCV